MKEVSEKEIFETMPVHKAVAAMAVPTIISQIVSIIYNLADTFLLDRPGIPIWWLQLRLYIHGLIC